MKSALAAGAATDAFKSGIERPGTTPSVPSRNAIEDILEENVSAGAATQDYPWLPDAPQRDQTALGGPCSSSGCLLLPTTFTTDVWQRLPTSSQELMQEGLSLMDSELEPAKSHLQQHPEEAGPARAAQDELHPRAQYKLNAVSAAHIFLQKRALPYDLDLSTRLAAQYGVTTKAVRDIWNRRTWTSVTDHL